ncbi:MAG TPA: response regulator transcription factor [Firmicutes bacterium]|nr:response regulator transcription factor [Bacillota bacterium]
MQENTPVKIIIADDEERIRRLVSDFLSMAGYTPIEAADGTEALEAFRQNPDARLMILDIMMPEMDGWAACRELRKLSDIPVIMLTARSEEFDQLTGFEAGADEYVIKPFSPAVLVKRVEALLRRAEAPAAPAGTDGLRIDADAYVAYLDGKPLELTLKEFEILKKLSEKPGRVYTRDQLLDAIWSYDFEGDSRTVDSHIARLRTKLGEYGNAHLKTVYGKGYKLEP